MKKKNIIYPIIIIVILLMFGISYVSPENPNASMDIKHPNNTGNTYNEKIVNSTKNKNPSSENINVGVNNIATVYPYNSQNWRNYNITINKNYLNLSDGEHLFLYTDILNTTSNSSALIDNDSNVHIEKNNKTIKSNVFLVKDKKSSITVKCNGKNKTYQLHNITVISSFGIHLDTNRFLFGYCENGHDDFEEISENTFKHYSYKLYGSTYTSASGLKKNKYGDCWGFSAYLYESLADEGYTVRVVQYPTNFSTNHRSVQIKLANNTWIPFPYREYGWGNFYDKELNNDLNETNTSVTKIVMTNENRTNKTTTSRNISTNNISNNKNR